VLLAARDKRPRPHRDDKVLTAWNGLMIGAFALGGAVLHDARYAEAARRAVDFVLARLFQPATGTLLRRFRDGDASIAGMLEDYAFFIQALLELYETQFQPRDLELAVALADKARELFEDSAAGGFFSAAAGDASLLLRVKEDYDGAEPSGNSVMALNLLRLAQFTGRSDLRASAERTLASFASRVSSIPAAVPQMLVAWQFAAGAPRQIVISGDPGAPDTLALVRAVHARFLPARVIMLLGDDASRQLLGGWLPAVASMGKLDGRAAAYVCENYTCRLPVNEPEKLTELLQ
jgi:uncharacterized protein YyaL (SSP411 family)